ncbi:hypothetical protein [Thermogemmatispora tikiterensis]|uniref:Uncharacterized protein n=1 Tax=Thermogemmatispora tikiterensis TaxID=1825093 RepID=A0A328VHS3_9CHLR|nr:hypothetical protein [Thermogemmatispora tikiterensis]RAQ95642.1 hypothetical protein A4R35_08865 [Thermogemmatispora tikiterensis]
MGVTIRRGIIQAFNPGTYQASVLLFEATSQMLQGVPVANSLDGSSGLIGALCAVLFFDEHNPQDAVVIATYANGLSGLPTPPPGRLTLVSGVQQINNVAISNGAIATFTLVGGSSGIPLGALAILARISFSASSQPAHLDIAPHGGNLAQTVTCGDLLSTTARWQGQAILPLDSNGQIDIRAIGATCTVTLTTCGYIS